MKAIQSISCVAMLLSILHAPLYPEDERTQSIFTVAGRQVTVLYDHFETYSGEEGIFRPYGHVEVRWESYRLKADFVQIDLKKKKMFAEGRMSIADVQSFLSGERMTFDFEHQTGEIEDSFGLLAPFLKYEAREIRQLDGNTVAADRMAITSCVQRVPRWEFSCRRGKLKKDKYVEMNGVLLKIKNVPVLYLPYLRYPISREGKQTGLLFPRVGWVKLQPPRPLSEEEKKTLQFSLRAISASFFWNLRPNFDLTFNVDDYQHFGTGIGEEFRYLFRKAAGNLRFLFFTYGMKDAKNPIQVFEGIDTLPEPERQERLRQLRRGDYYLEGSHEQQIPAWHSRFSYQLKWPSRMEFLRYMEYGFERNRANSIGSSVSWVTSVANWSFTAEASRTEIYDPLTRDSDIQWKRPSVNWNLNNQKLGKIPGRLSLNLSYENLLREGKDVMGGPEFFRNIPSRRMRVIPSYSLQLIRVPWLNGELRLSSKNNFYPKSFDPEKKEVIDKPLYMRFHEAYTLFRGPTFYRVYGASGRPLKHVIEPQLEFNYATKVNNSDRLLPVDYSDYPSSSYARVSLASRFYSGGSRQKGAVREVASLEIGQSYFLDPKAANYNQKINGTYPAFSEFNGKLRFCPSNDFSIFANLSYNYYIDAFSQLTVTLDYDRPGALIGGHVQLKSDRNPYQEKEFRQNWTRINGTLRFGNLRSPLKVNVAGDYDFTARESRYLGADVALDLQCMVFKVNILVQTINGRLTPTFLFGFSLGNLGMGKTFFEGSR